MTKVVIHAGFHKTGTSSVQRLIDENRKVLNQTLRCYLKGDFEALTEAARAFSADPSALQLAEVTQEAEAFFAKIIPADSRPILMSSEDLSGHMPGRQGVDCYDAAPLIMSLLADTARDRLGPDTEVVLYFSTRTPEAWLQSNWWQNLRSTRLTQSLADYSDTFKIGADLDKIVADTAEAAAPAQVICMDLEESTQLEFGPLTPLLDILEVPRPVRYRLKKLPPANVQPDLGLTDVFLALNRSELTPKALARVKKQLLKEAASQIAKDAADQA